MLEVFIITIQFLQCNTVHHNKIQHNAAYSTTHIQYNTTQHCTTQYKTLQLTVENVKLMYSRDVERIHLLRESSFYKYSLLTTCTAAFKPCVQRTVDKKVERC
jgi:hypothetical protein